MEALGRPPVFVETHAPGAFVRGDGNDLQHARAKVSPYAFNWFALPVIVTAIGSLAVGWSVLRRERTSPVGRALFFVTVVLGVWFGASALMLLANDYFTALMWTQVAYLAVPLLPVAIYLYLAVGLRVYQSQKILIGAMGSAALVFIGLAQGSRLLLSGVERH